MIVVGSQRGNGEQHKFNVASRGVHPVWSECRKVVLSDKRQIVANKNLPKCKGCFGDVADQAGPKPRRGGKHRK